MEFVILSIDKITESRSKSYPGNYEVHSPLTQKIT